MITAVITKPDKLSKVLLEVLKKSKKDVISVLSLKPHYSINTELKKACNGKQCVFIDTVSESQESNVVYIPSDNLTALSIAINQAQQPFNENVMIVFDSISHLALKNSPEMLVKFFVFLFSRARDWKVDMTIILPQNGVSPSLMSIIEQSVDKVVKK